PLRGDAVEVRDGVGGLGVAPAEPDPARVLAPAHLVWRAPHQPLAPQDVAHREVEGGGGGLGAGRGGTAEDGGGHEGRARGESKAHGEFSRGSVTTGRAGVYGIRRGDSTEPGRGGPRAAGLRAGARNA